LGVIRVDHQFLRQTPTNSNLPLLFIFKRIR